MNKYKIIYLDEDEADIELFQQFASEKFELGIIKIENEDELDDVIDDILTSRPDAVVTDYLLNEKARVKFNGQCVIEEIQKRNKHLPCFLLTSHAPDALQGTHDARIVQTKSVTSGGNDFHESKELFLGQIEKVIITFRSEYNSALTEYEELAAIEPAKLNTIQQQRLIELDDLLDSHGFSSSFIPSVLKDQQHIDLLVRLIESVDKVIGEKK